MLALLVICPLESAAQEGDARREAAKHFDRGVSLYSEADYRGALVEFKRAAGLVPNPAVFYNIGETEYQLQEYANALVTFQRYLAETAPTDPHRAEVEANVQTLKTRVGHIVVTSSAPGAEITIDDQPAGKTPIDKPILVSAGRRRVVASMPGRTPAAKYVEVAAEEVVAVDLQLPSPLAPPSEAPPPSTRTASPPRPAPATHGSGWQVAGWVATGAFAAAGASFGWMALKESRDLKTERGSYPTNASALDHTASLTMTYSILADSFAAAALVVGSVTLYSTISSSSRPGVPAASARLRIGPAFLSAEGTF
jgi:hypothetical protein